MKSGFLCSDCGKHLFHSIFRALFLTLKERSNEMSQHFEASFFRSENVSGPAVFCGRVISATAKVVSHTYVPLIYRLGKYGLAVVFTVRSKLAYSLKIWIVFLFEVAIDPSCR
ncbi:uncharacterized protein ARMOST_02086 [Armillaria ostoyae]|uniref:Uncharacterized protein n=1 Tax=Armillaria ostoyae TaxID=47428 RepID=A0A284QQT5_ARMOS|nr:uncharacterized protein ARMOST_02086 [Armillaria ostoyae]